jgi:dihydroorotate dehydrogenase (NAD+) catalytic subunit
LGEGIVLSINLCGLSFKNPVFAASGTFGYGLEFAEYCDLSAIGGICVKGISLKACEGNPMPRIRECAAGMLNAIGLQNIGVEAFLTDKLPKLKKFDTRVIVNFWGKSAEEYVETAKLLDESPADMLEMNISCPNIKEGGLSFSATSESAGAITAQVRRVVKRKPLIVKLSPNVADIKSYGIACERAGADGLSAINTLLGMAIDVKTRKPCLANITGGLSGPAVKPVAVRMVYELYKTVSIPIIGVGGIMNRDDVLEFFLAGASAVQVGTANFTEHNIIPMIVGELEEYCKDRDISELTGALLT